LINLKMANRILDEQYLVMNASEKEIYYTGKDLDAALSAMVSSEEFMVIVQHLRHRKITTPEFCKEYIEIEEQQWKRDELSAEFYMIGNSASQMRLTGGKNLLKFLSRRFPDQTS
jgi:hypothetical protein